LVISVTSPLPHFVKPCLPSLRVRPPKGDRWLHEIKFDGWRVQAIQSQGQVHLYSRNETDLTDRLQPLGGALRELGDKNFTIDGELIALDETGAPDFYAIPTAMTQGAVAFCMFDLLHLGKHDTRQLPLIERKELLAELVCGHKLTSIAVCDTFDDGEELLATCEKFGFEGIVSKRRDAPTPEELSHGSRSSAVRGASLTTSAGDCSLHGECATTMVRSRHVRPLLHRRR
jgi:bifunctional non-homologous end joining protein LigD